MVSQVINVLISHLASDVRGGVTSNNLKKFGDQAHSTNIFFRRCAILDTRLFNLEIPIEPSWNYL